MRVLRTWRGLGIPAVVLSIGASLLIAAPAHAAPAQSPSEAPVGPAGSLYLPEVDGNTVAVVDTATGKITGRIPVGPVGSRPAVMAATPDGSKLYVDNFGLLPATVTVINRRTNSTKTLLVGSTPLGAFSSNDGKEIYLPEVGFTVEVIRTATDTIVRRLHFAEIPVSAISGPDGNLYVGFASGQLGVYNPVTGAVIHKPIDTGGILTFWFTFSKDGTKLYTDTVNAIGVIDVAKWQLVKTISTGNTGHYSILDPGAFTSTLSPDGSKLYVTLFGATGVKVLDTATDTIVGTIPTTGSTTGVTFSADGSRGYISDLGPSSAWLTTPLGEAVLFGNLITLGALGPGQLIVFDPRTDRPVGAPIPTRAGPGIAAWVPPMS